MARRRWSEWASARMLRALVREGARVHAEAGVRTVAPPVFFSARGWKRVSKKRVRGRGSCILRPDSARYHTPDKANVLYLFLGQEPKARVGFYYSLGQDERKLFGASHLKKHDQPTHLPPYEYQFFQSAGTLKSTDQMVERLVRRYPPPNVALSSLTTVATAASLHAAPCAHMRAHANSASEPNLVARVNSLFSLYVSLIFQINRGR
jgi:hypothetical protein